MDTVTGDNDEKAKAAGFNCFSMAEMIKFGA